MTASSSHAADIPTPVKASPPAPVSGWTYQATFYGWATGLNGDIGVRDLPPAHVDVSAWEALENLNGAFMGSFLAKNDEWTILTDIIWDRISDSGSIGPGGGTVDFTQTQIIASGIVGYRLPLGLPENVALSGTVGLRYQHLKAEVDISPALLPIEISREGTKQWFDPTVGLLLQYQIDEKWFLNALADVGGFGVSSKVTAQGFLTVGYMWTPTISTAIGYRAIYTDYENDGFVYDVTQHGVFTSIGIHF